jgi:hypothetical protein
VGVLTDVVNEILEACEAEDGLTTEFSTFRSGEPRHKGDSSLFLFDRATLASSVSRQTEVVESSAVGL